MDNKIAVITGASSGLGMAMMKEFRRNGFTTVAVCRRRPDSPHDLWIESDICAPGAADAIASQLHKHYQKIDILINNAGTGIYDTWADMSMEDLRQLMELNFFSPVALTKALLPMLANAKGTVINIASIAGTMYVPCMGAYCASKAALNMFSDSLRAELAPSGIHVLNVMPGRINTGFSSRASGSRRPPETPAGGSSADRFAATVHKAAIRRQRSLIYPRWYRLVAAIPKLLPGLYDRKNRQMWKI